jgi:hypothetical protein
MLANARLRAELDGKRRAGDKDEEEEADETRIPTGRDRQGGDGECAEGVAEPELMTKTAMRTNKHKH